MALNDLKISSISAVIMLVLALPIIIMRVIGSPLIKDLTFEASIIYLPLSVLILLTIYQRLKFTPREKTP